MNAKNSQAGWKVITFFKVEPYGTRAQASASLGTKLNDVSEAHVSLLQYLFSSERSTVLIDPSYFLVTTIW